MKKKQKKDLNLEKVEKHLKKLRETELDVFAHYMQNPLKLAATNFFIGTAKGLGFFLGAAIVITFLAWILSKFLGTLPFAGEFFQAAAEWLNSNKPGV